MPVHVWKENNDIWREPGICPDLLLLNNRKKGVILILEKVIQAAHKIIFFLFLEDTIHDLDLLISAVCCFHSNSRSSYSRGLKAFHIVAKRSIQCAIDICNLFLEVLFIMFILCERGWLVQGAYFSQDQNKVVLLCRTFFVQIYKFTN